MAKTTNPLFSVAASGRIGKVLTFRQGETISTARMWRDQTAAASTYQMAARLRMSWASSIFATLTASERAKWQKYADAMSLPIFAAYMREFAAQQCTLTAHPLIPGTKP